MSSPVYFFPLVRETEAVKADRLRLEFLHARGVAAAFAGVRSVSGETSCYELPAGGPGAQSGLVLQVLQSAGGAPPPMRIGYHVDGYAWHERPAGCDCWVGIDGEYPPTPADLQHVERPQGYDVHLGDGNTWKVPIIRSPLGRDVLGRSQLPKQFGYDSEGRFRVSRRRTSDHLWELSGYAWDHIFDNAKHPRIDLEVVTELALGALALNYRVGKVEQELLGLVDSGNWQDCVEAIIDRPLVDEIEEQQKKTPA